MQQMWRNLRIGIVGQGSQYNRISKILKIKGIKFTTYKPPRNKSYYDKEKFKEDEVDELYGFPKTIEESSRIFLTLGRRDVKLEYQHRVLNPLEQS